MNGQWSRHRISFNLLLSVGLRRLAEAALYWGGDQFLKANNVERSRKAFKACMEKNPKGKWAKFSRGRLVAPVFKEK